MTSNKGLRLLAGPFFLYTNSHEFTRILDTNSREFYTRIHTNYFLNWSDH